MCFRSLTCLLGFKRHVGRTQAQLIIVDPASTGVGLVDVATHLSDLTIGGRLHLDSTHLHHGFSKPVLPFLLKQGGCIHQRCGVA